MNTQGQDSRWPATTWADLKATGWRIEKSPVDMPRAFGLIGGEGWILCGPMGRISTTFGVTRQNVERYAVKLAAIAKAEGRS